MFSTDEKRAIAKQVKRILRETNHPELPSTGDIQFLLHVDGAEAWSWANIRNSSAASLPCNEELICNTSVGRGSESADASVIQKSSVSSDKGSAPATLNTQTLEE